MVHNAAFLVSFLAAASAVSEPSGGIKFPFHLPDSASKAQQDTTILETKRRFDRHCFNFIFAVFDKHENMDEVAVTSRVLPLCKAASDRVKCQKWSADLYTVHENKKRKHDKKGAALLAGPKSNGEWCAELYAADALVPVEVASAKLDVHTESAGAPKLRGQMKHAEHSEHVEHVEHVHAESVHAESVHAEQPHTKTENHAAKVEPVHPQAMLRKEEPAKKVLMKAETQQHEQAVENKHEQAVEHKHEQAVEHKHEQAVRRAAETPTKPKEAPKEAAHELPKVVYAKTTTVKPVAIVNPSPDKSVGAVKPVMKKEGAVSTTVAPATVKPAESKPVSMKKTAETKAITPVKVEDKPVVPSTAIAKSVVKKQAPKKKEEDECLPFRRADGMHWSCPPGKTPPLPVQSQGAIIAAKALTELPANSNSGLSSLWSAFNGAESAAKGLFSSLQMRW